MASYTGGGISTVSTPTGPAGGSLTGSYPNPTISATTPISEQKLATSINAYYLNGSVAMRETVHRAYAAQGSLTTGTTGVMYSVAVVLYAGDVISKICMRSGSTALGTGTHWWFALYDTQSTSALISQTADMQSSAWAGTTVQDLFIGTTRADGAITSGSPTFTSATGTFSAGDIGKAITVSSAGASATLPLITTISAVGSTTSITLAANAGTTASSAQYTYAVPYTVPTSGVYYIGQMVAASQLPTITGISSVSNPVAAGFITGQKQLGQTSGSALVGAAPSTIASAATSGSIIYAIAH